MRNLPTRVLRLNAEVDVAGESAFYSSTLSESSNGADDILTTAEGSHTLFSFKKSEA